VLLFANGLGGVLGGLLLEGTGWLRLSVRAAMWSTAVYGLSSALFAFSHDYLVAARTDSRSHPVPSSSSPPSTPPRPLANSSTP
jgi:hypothetical protein